MIELSIFMALFIGVIVFFMPVFSCDLRRNKSILFAYWFVIILHQAVAYINAFLVETIGAGEDASTFNQVGGELAQAKLFSFSVGASFYENMLGVVYWLFGTSHILGEQLSVLAFSLSCVVLIKILRQLDLLRSQIPVLLLFGALPTMVFLGSITLRESYQVLFFMLAVYFGIKMHLKGGINRNFFLFVLSAFVMGLFHNGLIAYMVFLIVLFMLFPIKPTTYIWRVRKLHVLLLFLAPVFFMGLLVIANVQVSGLSALSALANLEVVEYASNYRANSVTARASYGVDLDLSSPSTFIFSSFILYFYYLFAPLPWQIGGVMDVYAALESILRILLLYFSVKHWRNTYGIQRRLLGLMLILFFSMSFLWALGTTNYGTAMRHHMLSWWILVVVGTPQLMAFTYRFRMGSISKWRPCLTSVVKDN